MWTPDDWTRSSIIIIGCTLAWLLAPGPPGAEPRVDLQVLVWSLPHQSDVEMDLVLTEFEEERGLVIDLVRAPDPDTYLDFLDDLRTTGDMPDLLLVDPGLAVDLDDERALAALDLHFAHPDDLPVAAEELLVEYTLDGFIYGVPVAADGEQHAAAYAISVDAVDHGRGELAFELLERLADALPAVEDDGFRDHAGVSWWGIGRAAVANLRAVKRLFLGDALAGAAGTGLDDNLRALDAGALDALVRAAR